METKHSRHGNEIICAGLWLWRRLVLKLHHSAPICRLWQGEVIRSQPGCVTSGFPSLALHDISEWSSTLLLGLCACVNAPNSSRRCFGCHPCRKRFDVKLLMSSWDQWGWMHLIGVCLDGAERGREGEGVLHSFPKRAVLAGRLTACLSTWCGDWVWAVTLSPSCLWNLGYCVFITCASALFFWGVLP